MNDTYLNRMTGSTAIDDTASDKGRRRNLQPIYDKYGGLISAPQIPAGFR